jgi:Protein of unknown function (DUF3179)
VYARKVADDVLDFGHRGWLYEESFLFYDYQSDSLWLQATGEAVHGKYQGTKLDRLPATQTTWSEWRQLHPDTQALSRPQNKNARYHRDSYELYYATGKGIKYQRHKELTFGLAVIKPGGPKLYPFAELEKQPMIADQIGSEAVLVVFHSPSRTAVAWEPRYEGQVLGFDPPKVEKADLLLTDRRTGSIWSGLTGRCLEGPAKGKQLRQLTTTQFVVENWLLHYPQAPIYHRDMSPEP